MSEIKYPRTAGSGVSVLEENWVQNGPFGHCPACGSLAMEDIHLPGEPDINFYCSDKTCRDKHGRRTMWGDTKTAELLALEVKGGSWNKEKYPGQSLPDVCPD